MDGLFCSDGLGGHEKGLVSFDITPHNVHIKNRQHIYIYFTFLSCTLPVFVSCLSTLVYLLVGMYMHSGFSTRV